MIKNFLNPEGHQNPISVSKVTAILLTGWILPLGGASSGRVCASGACAALLFFIGATICFHQLGPSGGEGGELKKSHGTSKKKLN